MNCNSKFFLNFDSNVVNIHCIAKLICHFYNPGMQLNKRSMGLTYAKLSISETLPFFLSEGLINAYQHAHHRIYKNQQ